MPFTPQLIAPLFLAGIAALLLGTLLGAVAARRDNRLLRYPAVLLVLAGTASSLIATGAAVVADELRWSALALIGGALIAALGLIGLLLEIRRRVRIKQSGLTLAAGLLLCVASVFLPIIPGQLSAPPRQTPTPTAATATRTPLPTRTPAVSLTPTALPTRTFTPTPLPTLTATPGLPSALPVFTTETLVPIGSPAPLPSEPAVNPTWTPAAGLSGRCALVPFRNVNLRQSPDTTSPIRATIPYGTQVQGIGQGSGWWQVRYDGSEGWITADYVTPSDAAACRALPAVRLP